MKSIIACILFISVGVSAHASVADRIVLSNTEQIDMMVDRGSMNVVVNYPGSSI
jgi:hypothetical protein